MLPNPFRWIDSDDGSYLHYFYGCVGNVQPRNGKWMTTVRWCGYQHEAQAGSRAQGKRWVELWCTRQKGFPGGRRVERRR